jgi:hypothetical protein
VSAYNGLYCPAGSTEPLVCEGGFYCDAINGTTREDCPAGYFCPLGTDKPYKCALVSECDANSSAPGENYYTLLILGILVGVILVVVVSRAILPKLKQDWNKIKHSIPTHIGTKHKDRENTERENAFVYSSMKSTRLLITGQEQTKARKMFDAIDTDGNGAISLEELTVYAKATLLPKQYNFAKMKRIYAQIDTNQDGSLSFPEFKQFIVAHKGSLEEAVRFGDDNHTEKDTSFHVYSTPKTTLDIDFHDLRLVVQARAKTITIVDGVSGSIPAGSSVAIMVLPSFT